jgi:predicted nucleic acid-binding protein
VPLYLADSSIWIGRRRPDAAYLQQLFIRRFEQGQLAACVPVALEVLVSPRDGAAYEADWAALWAPLRWLPLRERATRRALEVQRALARTTAGAHRRKAIDYLIAACAEDAGEDVVLWHWDADMTAICEHTGQPHEPEHERVAQHGLD